MASESMDRKVNLRPRLTEELQAHKLAIAEIKRDLETNTEVISHLKHENGALLNRKGALQQKQRLLKAKQAKVTKDIQQLQRELRQKKKNLNPQQGQLPGLKYMLQRRSDQLAQQKQINCDLEAVLKELCLQLPCHLNFPGLSEMVSAVTGGAQTTARTIPAEEKDALDHRRQPAEGTLTTACPSETESTVTGGAQTTAEEKEASLHALDLQ